jgi:GntR family transcriptional regulator
MGSGSRSKLRSRAVRDRLLSRIARGKLRPGSQLPPEPDLAAELGVSRATLREALRSLQDEGLLTRSRGTGTFVSHVPRMLSSLDANFGVTDAIRAAGMEPGFEEAVTRIEPALAAEAARLHVEPGEHVVVVERVRTADGRRVVWSQDVVPAWVLDRRPEALPTLARGSMYETLEREIGISIHHGVARFAPMKADRPTAQKLGVPRNTLVLYLQQVDFDDGGRPVLSSHEWHLADAFDFTVIRRGPGRRFT